MEGGGVERRQHGRDRDRGDEPRIYILDGALLHPGRFDRRVPVELPDITSRAAILATHAVGKPLGPSVDMHQIAQRTTGFSGTGLKNLLKCVYGPYTTPPRLSSVARSLVGVIEVEKIQKNCMRAEHERRKAPPPLFNTRAPRRHWRDPAAKHRHHF